MLLNYELTQRDFYEAIVAHRNRVLAVRWGFRVVIALMLLILVCGVLSFAIRRDLNMLSNFSPLLLLFTIWLALQWTAPWLSARKQYQQQPSAKGLRTMKAAAEGVHWTWQGGATFIEWPMFVRWLESKTQFLIYTSPICFHMVPKRVLSTEQIEEVRSLLRQNISTNK